MKTRIFSIVKVILKAIKSAVQWIDKKVPLRELIKLEKENKSLRESIYIWTEAQKRLAQENEKLLTFKEFTKSLTYK